MIQDDDPNHDDYLESLRGSLKDNEFDASVREDHHLVRRGVRRAEGGDGGLEPLEEAEALNVGSCRPEEVVAAHRLLNRHARLGIGVGAISTKPALPLLIDI